MGDPHDDPGAKSFSAPPGCGFHPSQQQLLSYYLTKKNNVVGEGSDGCDLIGELDLYHYDPFELPDGACFSYGYGASKRNWYCYAARNEKESEAGRRRTKTGYWRRKWGKVRDVMDPRRGGKVLLGTRSCFVFYQKNSSMTAARITDWVMHEYALPDHLKASFVLCRVFFKSCSGNSILDNGLSSCAEEAVSAVRHIGIQHNGCLTPDILEVKMHEDNSVSGASILHQSGMQPRELKSSSVLPGSSAKIFEGLTDQQALSILEEDYIELDDLVQ
ncbi:NAC domain-containing protein 6-like isoform X2 [Juglans microcarpa x Juglans regia]|uniref:NAC domain-containing protein 6-like isoform X2 n=1 Tax=Juglans microcarpa x Juglans regia TaxID=2249226 RepID=UPI001B7E3143|nr:NAC domain-containing protein 6-like isoform X2 [Juglans microcarpa x Juglans regia]